LGVMYRLARELRQKLSVYLRRVVAGEALDVTDPGCPVAVLPSLLAKSPLAGSSLGDCAAAPEYDFPTL
jgi:antitoxin (DNA-binding transcriptional repressor) of toxin-antitoxin stability system